MKRFPHVRKEVRLSEWLHRQLGSYALTASAAGVGMLALAQPAEAKIIYTKAHQVIGGNGVYQLDLNHDGIIDFLILESPVSFTSFTALYTLEALGNAVQGYSSGPRSKFADALSRGARIGPGQRFVTSPVDGEDMADVWATNHSSGSGGQWRNVSNRYLGLKFKIDGKTHYGWARLSVKVNDLQITATLTGYAYETVPDEGLRAGQIASQELPLPSAATPPALLPEPTSLGTLALGAASRTFRSNP